MDAHDHERGHANGERRQVGLRQFGRKLQEPRDDAARFDRETEHLPDLAQNDADGNAVHEADEDRLAEKVGQESEPEMPAMMHATPERMANVTASAV